MNTLCRMYFLHFVSGTAILFLEMMSAISIFISVIVLNIHHFGAMLGGDMSRCTRFLVFGVLASLTCSRSLVRKYGLKFNAVKPNTFGDKWVHMNKVDKRLHRSWERLSLGNNLYPSVTRLLREIKKVTKKIDEDAESERIALEWKIAALIVDRFLMLVCSVVIIVVMGVLFVPLIKRKI